ncbi:hypothetical protein GCM10025867_51190 (plasmid) [Frondihabitans sucicola]|uniref:Uncharacterized protein n=1 Tax=Frondihabitans sucicola TaxID=1268041 RepID=A0ABN6YA38_9MICO|nr:hypothetical protein [Frondihabitans sucicola]BDZ52878.1 hypothetical protein GCM10025867_51190 [Frondihabitans sucicola]
MGPMRTTESFHKADITRKKVADVLAGRGIFHETPELKAAYEKSTEDYRKKLTEGFAEQFRFTGIAGRSYRSTQFTNRRVIHDIAPKEIPAFAERTDSELFGAVRGQASDGDTTGEVPIRSVLRVFDLHNHDFLWVNSQDLTAYEYDLTLRDKLVLPADHRELLDILTTDIATFTGDIIEGKSAGNVILCKGVPGVGKTLTSEVYSELIKRPCTPSTRALWASPPTPSARTWKRSSTAPSAGTR